MINQSVSLVCTVRDEADNIAALLDSMQGQSCLPQEIIINNCGSRDATAQIVANYLAPGSPFRIVHGGHNIASGRNNAIRHARGPLIACTDAGLTLEPDWLEQIVFPLECGAADVVGGFFRPDPQTFFELVLGAANYPDKDEINPAIFLPAGMSMAFRKSAWEHVGGYPEWADYGEDLIFDLHLRQQGYHFAFAPDAVVQFRPRSSLLGFARQYFHYAQGDGYANLWWRRHVVRYLVYLLSLYFLYLTATSASLWPIIPLAGGSMAYASQPFFRLSRRAPHLTPAERMIAGGLILLIRGVGDVAKMIGYPVGLLRRIPCLR